MVLRSQDWIMTVKSESLDKDRQFPWLSLSRCVWASCARSFVSGHILHIMGRISLKSNIKKIANEKGEDPVLVSTGEITQGYSWKQQNKTRWSHNSNNSVHNSSISCRSELSYLLGRQHWRKLTHSWVHIIIAWYWDRKQRSLKQKKTLIVKNIFSF